MDSVRYIGLDVHRDTVSAAVLDGDGKLMMQSVFATRAAAILDFMHGIKGTMHVTFEEGTHSAWLYDLLARRVAQLVVCDPRRNALLKSGNKGDLIDARKLAELLRNHALSPVYHGESSALEMQHRTRSYTTLTEDTTRVMNRLKALFRGQAIGCPGKKLFRKDHRESYLAQLGSEGLRHRARCLYQELEVLHPLRLQAKRAMIAEGRKHPATKWLQSVPFLGKVRSAVLNRPGADAASLPHQASVLGLLWAGTGDAKQR